MEKAWGIHLPYAFSFSNLSWFFPAFGLNFSEIIAPVSPMDLRPFILGFAAVTAFVAHSALATVNVFGSEVKIDDGISLELPIGWNLTTNEQNPADPLNGGEQKTVLLFHAKPLDDERHASLSFIRDGGAETGKAAQAQIRTRLTDIAGEQGYKVTKFNTKGRVEGPNTITINEAIGASGEGKRRIFTCVTFTRANLPTIRCYYQYDESDLTSRSQFDDFFASMKCDNVLASDVLWNGATMVAHDSSSDSSSPATATAPPAPSSDQKSGANTSAQVGEMVTKHRDDLVVIEGSKGRGSGFVCNVGGQPFLMTNIHVMANNPQPKFNTMNGKSLTVGASSLGVDHDIFKGALTEAPTSLEILENLDQTAKIGDPIAVLGNPEGAGVIKPLEGRIVGIGPNLVEVDAPFVQGNSGSPIIHIPTGKVIGIATYLIIRKVDTKEKDGVETTVRRFGYRVDNVAKWEPVNWTNFYTQSAQAAKIEENGEDFIELFKDAKEGKMRSTNYQNPGIQRALFNLERTAGSRMSAADLASTRRQFLGDLRIAAMSDINSFDNRTAYDYFRRQVADEKKFRDDLYSGFTRMIEANR